MKSLLAMLALIILFVAGCSKKNSSNPVDAPGNTQPAVNFTMHLESGSQGMVIFAKPDVDVKLTKVVLSFPAGNFTDTVTNDNPQTVFPKNIAIQLGEYTGIDGGQQWVLTFHGTIAATGQQFVKTINWTVV